MTAAQIITAALRLCGLVVEGETPTPEALADGLEALQVMLREWASRGLLVYADVVETKVLTVSQNTYTWGLTTGNIATDRPTDVLRGWIGDGLGTDYPVEKISEAQYQALAVKGVSSRPNRLMYRQTYPLGILYLYPTPSAAETISLVSIKPWPETSSFDVTTSTMSFPPHYQRAIKYNLAVEIAPEWGKQLSALVYQEAKDSLQNLLDHNAAAQVTPSKLTVIKGTSGGGYNITSDTGGGSGR